MSKHRFLYLVSVGNALDSSAIVEAIRGFVIPIGALVISLSFTLWIAHTNRIEQRREQQRQRDQKFADAFLQETEHIYGHVFVNDPVALRLQALDALQASSRRMAEFASGSTRGELGVYMYGQIGELRKAVRAIMREEHRERTAEMRGGAQDYTRHDSAVSELQRAADIAIHNIRSAARDWPDLDRRRRLLRKLAAQAIAQWEEPPTDVQLAIDRALLASLPSRSRIRRIRERSSVEWRRLVDDWRYGRLGHRLDQAVSNLKEEFYQRRFKRTSLRAGRQQSREDRALRRLYEAAYRHSMSTGRPFTLTYPRSPEVLDAVYLTPPGPEETF